MRQGFDLSGNMRQVRGEVKLSALTCVLAHIIIDGLCAVVYGINPGMATNVLPQFRGFCAFQCVIDGLIVGNEGMKMDNTRLVILQCAAPVDTRFTLPSPILGIYVVINAVNPEIELFFSSFRVRRLGKRQGTEPLPGVFVEKITVGLGYLVAVEDCRNGTIRQRG